MIDQYLPYSDSDLELFTDAIQGHRITRIAFLEAGSPHDELVYTLRRDTLRDLLPCEALSYTWASNDNTDTIFKSSVALSNGGCFAIGPTLDAALRQLRYCDRSRAL